MKIIKEIKISDNGFVFNSNTGDSFSLNSTGLELIQLILQEKELEEIKETITSRFDVDEMTFERDFYEFCFLLKIHQLIAVENTSEFN